MILSHKLSGSKSGCNFKIFRLLFLATIQTVLSADESLIDAIKTSSISGYLKTMYIQDDRKGTKLDQTTFGLGGKVALTTGEYRSFRGSVAYYKTDDLGLRTKNPKETDAYMFDVDKKPYTVMGEAFVEYKYGNTKLKFGRQEIDTPFISTYDYRIIPNLFEAYTLTNQDIKDTTITVAYVAKMSGLDGVVSFKDFESMSEQTYTSLMLDENNKIDTGYDIINVSKISSHQGVVVIGLAKEGNPRFQIWNYYCKDVLNGTYADIAYTSSLDKANSITFEGQAYSITEIGKFKDFLSKLGLNGSYNLYGAKITSDNKEVGTQVSAAYNRFTGNDKTVTVFGNWGGYPEYVGIPFLFAEHNNPSPLANAGMFKVSLKYDMSRLGLGDSASVGYTIIDTDKKIIQDTDIKMLSATYKIKFGKNISAKALYELRNSKNYRYDNDTLTLSLNYGF